MEIFPKTSKTFNMHFYQYSSGKIYPAKINFNCEKEDLSKLTLFQNNKQLNSSK